MSSAFQVSGEILVSATRPLRRLSVAELSAEHLRAGLRAGRWRGAMPGVLRLAAEVAFDKIPFGFGGSTNTLTGNGKMSYERTT